MTRRPSAGPSGLVRRVLTLLDEAVAPAVFGPTEPVGIAVVDLPGEPLPVESATVLPARPATVGLHWGPRWGTSWFRLRGRVPESWAGEHVVLRFENQFLAGEGTAEGCPGGEGLLWHDGVPIEGLSSEAPYASVPVGAGERFELWVEAAANPRLGEPHGAWPLLLADPGGPPQLRLVRCEIAVRNRTVSALAADLRVLTGLAVERLPAGRADEISGALGELLSVLDADDVPGTAAEARTALAPALARPAPGDAQRISAIGHAHIDTSWLWPARETVRKVARTLANALTLAAEHPGYVFAMPAAQHVSWVEEAYPALFERLRAAIAAGAVVPVGGMWVEADVNLPSGESLIRQFVHGQRYYTRVFGRPCTEAWLPDDFGMPAGLPTVLAAVGLRRFVTQKLSWNDTTVFPHHTFWWEGLDGARVLAHFPTSDTYSGLVTPRNLRRSVDTAALPAERALGLYLYGFGDGGGGPTREMLENADRSADLDGLPAVHLEPPDAFFERLEAREDDLPVWAGELYLERHRGTYTSQARTKAGNRACERTLAAAELWSALRPPGSPAPVHDLRDLERAWTRLLVTQFHDILPGSSIRWVYDDTARDHAEVLRLAGRVRDEAAGELATALGDGSTPAGTPRSRAVFNSTPFRRREVVEIDGMLRRVDVPPMGVAVVPEPSRHADADPDGDAHGGVTVGDGWVRNEALEVRWDDTGALTSVVDLATGRQVLAPGERGNVYHLHVDDPADFDAWELDAGAFATGGELDSPVDVEVVERGPLLGRVRFTRRVGVASTLRCDVVLSAGSRRIDFETGIDWHEEHRLLKVAFPVDVDSAAARCAVAFGHVRRPTRPRTVAERARFEFCAHQWVEVGEPEFGVALLSDSRYGYDLDGQRIRLSLLRAPTAPDPTCDRGEHRFTYSLTVHSGDLRDVLAQTAALGTPLLVLPTSAAEQTRSFLAVDDPAFVLEAVKPADDGDGIVVRGFEALGGARSVVLRTEFPVRTAQRADAFERDRPLRDTAPCRVEEDPDGRRRVVRFEVAPFELVSLRLRA